MSGENSLLRTNKHTLHIQIHDFLERTLGVLIKLLSPSRAGIGEEDVDVVGVLGDFGDEALDLACFGDVRGDGDGFAFGVGQGVEGRDGFFARFGFARGDEDFAAAGLGEAVKAWWLVGGLQWVAEGESWLRHTQMLRGALDLANRQ